MRIGHFPRDYLFRKRRNRFSDRIPDIIIEKYTEYDSDESPDIALAENRERGEKVHKRSILTSNFVFFFFFPAVFPFSENPDGLLSVSFPRVRSLNCSVPWKAYIAHLCWKRCPVDIIHCRKKSENLDFWDKPSHPPLPSLPPQSHLCCDPIVENSARTFCFVADCWYARITVL